MKRLLLLGYLAHSSFAAAQGPVDLEADRLRTQQLNHQADAVTSRRDRTMVRRQNQAEAQYRAARDRYEEEMATWQRRVAMCEAGDDRACVER
jgi:hypothetical protein